MFFNRQITVFQIACGITKKIKIGGQSVFNKTLFSIGMWTVEDLYENNTLIPYKTWQNRGASNIDKLVWSGIVNCINSNKDRFKAPSSQSIVAGIMLDSRFIPIQNVQQNHIKQCLAKRKLMTMNELKFKMKAESIYGPITEQEWENIFLLPHKTFLDNKTKELQYRITMRYLGTNYLLYQMKKIPSQSCSFCMIQAETIEHLFYNCNIVKHIWFDVFREWREKTSRNDKPSLQSCVLGLSFIDNSNENLALYAITLLVKMYIVRCKYEGNDLSPVAFSNSFRLKIDLLNKVYHNDVLDILNLMYQD